MKTIIETDPLTLEQVVPGKSWVVVWNHGHDFPEFLGLVLSFDKFDIGHGLIEPVFYGVNFAHGSLRGDPVFLADAGLVPYQHDHRISKMRRTYALPDEANPLHPEEFNVRYHPDGVGRFYAINDDLHYSGISRFLRVGQYPYPSLLKRRVIRENHLVPVYDPLPNYWDVDLDRVSNYSGYTGRAEEEEEEEEIEE